MPRIHQTTTCSNHSITTLSSIPSYFFMAPKIQPWMLLFQFLVFISVVPPSLCQSNSPQNIQTFYPFPLPPIGRPPTSPNNESISPPPPPGKSSSKGAVAKAIGVTAASTLVLSALFFFLLHRYSKKRKEQVNRNNPVEPSNEFKRFKGNIKGLVVDEDGLDVLYWRSLEGEDIRKNYSKEVLNSNKKEEVKQKIIRRERSRKSELPLQEFPFLRDKSSTSQHQVWLEVENGTSIQPTTRSPPPTPPPPQPPLAPVLAIPTSKSLAPPPPPPLPLVPLLAIPTAKSIAPPPPPPPIPAKKGPAPPPPPPKPPGFASSISKPPPAPKGTPSDDKKGESSSKEGLAGDGNGQVKLKPLHWDKVNPNVDHSMVWDKIDGGSFRFDDDLMEALFGNVATSRRSPRTNNNSTTSTSERTSPLSQILILDARKSQNTAIVLRSLAISRKEIIDTLMEGRGLNVDTLEKLSRIAPTKEEESEILAFVGDPTRLADAESFLYHLLKAIPSAFTRFNAMLFRSIYDSEILQLKEYLQTLELGCNELRTRGLFLKLLEAILKAGNRMNAGTSRGNAQAFNLSALRKLSDVKSSDGKTTLLNFVVEEVVRSEGKRCVLNSSRSLSRSSSRNSDNLASKDDRENEYIKLGLAVVGGLSAEFSNVKKAATIDYDTLAKTGSALAAKVAEIRQLLTKCGNGDGGEGGFVKEMKSFLEVAEQELQVVTEEQARVMELVKRTTNYYQSGNSKDKEKHPLQLFVIVKDFLGMVDQVCIDIARNQQKRKTNVGSPSNTTRTSVKFPILPANFMSDKSKSSSSDSDGDSN